VSGGGSGYSNGGSGGYINMPLISIFVLFYSLSEHKRGRWQPSRGMPPPSHFIIVLYYVFIPNSNKILLVVFMNI
jgi:hypothetical protein